MRTATFLCLGLLLVSSFALTMKSKLNSAQMKQIEALRTNNKSWSKIILNLAELHMMTQGPLDDLVSALDDLLNDLADKIIRAHEDFDVTTGLHNSEVARLTNEISSANADIASTTSLLADVLYPSQADLQQRIAADTQEVADLQAYIQRIIHEREEAHANFEIRVEDHEGAVAAIKEAQDLLSSLLYSDNISLVQVKNAKAGLNKIQKKLSKHLHATLVKALVQVATSEFANQELVRDVSQKLDEIRDKILESLVSEHANEETEQRNFEESRDRSYSRIAQLEENIASNKIALDNVTNSIAENELFLALKQNDLANSTQNLELENQHYNDYVANYNDVVGQLNTELAAAQQAFDIVNDGNFATYIEDRLNNVEGSSASHFQA